MVVSSVARSRTTRGGVLPRACARSLPFQVSRYGVFTQLVSEAVNDVRLDQLEEFGRSFGRHAYPRVLLVTIEIALDRELISENPLQDFLVFLFR